MAMGDENIRRLRSLAEKGRAELLWDIPGDKDEILKAAVAFANAEGGALVFGARRSPWKVRGFKGLELFERSKEISDLICSSCSPILMPEMAVMNVGAGGAIVAWIPCERSRMPFYIAAKGKADGSFVRVGGDSVKASPETVRELELASRGRRFENLLGADEVSHDRARDLCMRLNKHALSLSFHSASL